MTNQGPTWTVTIGNEVYDYILRDNSILLTRNARLQLSNLGMFDRIPASPTISNNAGEIELPPRTSRKARLPMEERRSSTARGSNDPPPQQAGEAARILAERQRAELTMTPEDEPEPADRDWLGEYENGTGNPYPSPDDRTTVEVRGLGIFVLRSRLVEQEINHSIGDRRFAIQLENVVVRATLVGPNCYILHAADYLLLKRLGLFETRCGDFPMLPLPMNVTPPPDRPEDNNDRILVERLGVGYLRKRVLEKNGVHIHSGMPLF